MQERVVGHRETGHAQRQELENIVNLSATVRIVKELVLAEEAEGNGFVGKAERAGMLARKLIIEYKEKYKKEEGWDTNNMSSAIIAGLAQLYLLASDSRIVRYKSFTKISQEHRKLQLLAALGDVNEAEALAGVLKQRHFAKTVDGRRIDWPVQIKKRREWFNRLPDDDYLLLIDYLLL